MDERGEGVSGNRLQGFVGYEQKKTSCRQHERRRGESRIRNLTETKELEKSSRSQTSKKRRKIDPDKKVRTGGFVLILGKRSYIWRIEKETSPPDC